jgi:uncharacterized NAD-dependent epimerase/dehydratase family protein
MPRYLIFSEGQFGTPASKTGNSVIRYSADHVAAVLDSRLAGKTVGEVLGFGGDIPIVSTVGEGVARGADALMVGIAVASGELPAPARAGIKESIERGLEIWNGLHTFVAEDRELGPLAAQRGVGVHDVRRPPDELPVGAGRVRELGAEKTVVLAVGSDANIGKMTVMLQLRSALAARGTTASFAPTGQTGIFIDGWGVCVDAVVADFVAGAAEQVTIEGAKRADIVLVEGQGSILHGSLPHALIACHMPTRATFRHNSWLKIPPITDVIALHEAVANPLRPVKTIGVSLNTVEMSEREARAEIERVENATGLPTTDPVRFDTKPLADAVLEFHSQRTGSAAARCV